MKNLIKVFALAAVVMFSATSCSKESKDEVNGGQPPVTSTDVTLTGKIFANDQNYAYGSHFIVTATDTVALQRADNGVALSQYEGVANVKVTGTYVDGKTNPKLLTAKTVGK